MENLFFLTIFLIYNISLASTSANTCTPKLSENISDYSQASIITFLTNTAKYFLEEAKNYATVKTSCSMPMDCAAILEEIPSAKSGIYQIWPRSRVIEGSIDVYCDMVDDGGAWTVVQRRGDFNSGDLYFFKNWLDYKHGFGDLQKDFWLGNDKIFALTNQRLNTVKFVLTDWEKNTTYATYDDFWIDEEARNYTLHVSGFRGTAGDSFTYHDGCAFSTKDRDNDVTISTHCAATHKSAWWYKFCYYSNLNGMYFKEVTNSTKGINWHSLKGNYSTLKDAEIKIRPKKIKKRVLEVVPH